MSIRVGEDDEWWVFDRTTHCRGWIRPPLSSTHIQNTKRCGAPTSLSLDASLFFCFPSSLLFTCRVTFSNMNVSLFHAVPLSTVTFDVSHLGIFVLSHLNPAGRLARVAFARDGVIPS